MERSFKILKQFSLKLIQDLSEDLLGSDTIPWILNHWGQFWLTLDLREVIRIPFAGKWIEFYRKFFREKISLESLRDVAVPEYIHDKNCSLPLMILFPDKRIIAEYISFVGVAWGLRADFRLEGSPVKNWDDFSLSTTSSPLSRYVQWVHSDCHMLTAGSAQKIEDGNLLMKDENGSWVPLIAHSGTLTEALIFDMYRNFNTPYALNSFNYAPLESVIQNEPYRVFFGKSQLSVGGRILVPCVYMETDQSIVFDAYEVFVPTGTDKMFVTVP